MSEHHKVIIVGGGSAGLTVAARLRNLDNPMDVAIIEPSEKHYYQPIWTLVGAGVFGREMSMRNEADFIPDGATWIKDKVDSFAPGQNSLKTAGGKELTYDYLVVCPGLQINWDQVKGLEGNLGKNGICSNYTYDTVNFTWEALQNTKKGKAVFTQPNTAIKCGGAPQKIMYLADDYFRKNGVRDQVEVHFFLPPPHIFGVAKYRNSLEKIVESRDLITHFRHHLVEVRADQKEAIFENLDDKSTTAINFDMLHVTPPMGPMDFLKKSPLVDDAGWVDVDKGTLQHKKFENVFALGDCANLPTAKTGAAVRKQAPILVHNMLAHQDGKPLDPSYNGYTSCPLVTGFGKLILAEFDYDGQPDESFPFDQSKERYSMYALKAYGLPEMYWHGMLRGRA